jgi:hypothetical protein
MSTSNADLVLGDCKIAVELETDIFETFEMFFYKHYGIIPDNSQRMFSHGIVEYYDIDNQPASIENCRWREVYLKHAKFAFQKEYRAALCVSDTYFNRTTKTPMVVEHAIFSLDGERLPFNAKFILSSDEDKEGWRYIEIDMSVFQKNLEAGSNKIFSYAN